MTVYMQKRDDGSFDVRAMATQIGMFSAGRANDLLSAIANGDPLRPSLSGWTPDDMQQALGALLFALWSRGPKLYASDDPGFQQHRAGPDYWRTVDPRLGLVGLFAQLTQDVCDGTYDQHDPLAVAVVYDEQTQRFEDKVACGRSKPATAPT
jgi:hypothetical protein